MPIVRAYSATVKIGSQVTRSMPCPQAELGLGGRGRHHRAGPAAAGGGGDGVRPGRLPGGHGRVHAGGVPVDHHAGPPPGRPPPRCVLDRYGTRKSWSRLSLRRRCRLSSHGRPICNLTRSCSRWIPSLPACVMCRRRWRPSACAVPSHPRCGPGPASLSWTLSRQSRTNHATDDIG